MKLYTQYYTLTKNNTTWTKHSTNFNFRDFEKFLLEKIIIISNHITADELAFYLTIGKENYPKAFKEVAIESFYGIQIHQYVTEVKIKETFQSPKLIELTYKNADASNDHNINILFLIEPIYDEIGE